MLNRKEKNTYNRNMKKFFVYFISIISFLFLPLAAWSEEELTQSEVRVLRERFIKEAKNSIDAPYTSGKRGPATFDEAGFVHFYVQTVLEIVLPATVRGIYDFAQIVADSEREPGDLVFFRNSDGSAITDMGIYLGNGKFLACSKNYGNKKSVQEYSMKDAGWKNSYAATGKLLPQSKLGDSQIKASSTAEKKTAAKKADKKAKKAEAEEAETSSEENPSENDSEESTSSKKKSAKSKKSASSSSSRQSYSGGADGFILSTYLTGDWSLFTEKRFMPNFRGLTALAVVDYEGETLTPGAGFALRWNNGAGVFQIPLIFSLKAGDYVRFYAGPTFTIGNAQMTDSDKSIKASIFPGIFGMTVYLPSFTSGDLKVQVIQDINYSFYNNVDGSMLNPLESLASGIELSTGISVTLPMSMFF